MNESTDAEATQVGGHRLSSFTVQNPTSESRVREPVSLGVPIADGNSADTVWSVQDAHGRAYPAQFRILDHWPSGCPRWVLVTVVVDLPAAASLVFHVVEQDSFKPATNPTQQSDFSPGCTPSHTKCDWRKFRFGGEGLVTISSSSSPQFDDLIIRGNITDKRGRVHTLRRIDTAIIEDGTHYEHLVIRAEGPQGLRAELSIVRYRFRPLLKMDCTLHNPRRAEHAGGYWDLGDPQSMLFRAASLQFESAKQSTEINRVQWTIEPRSQPTSLHTSQFSLVQGSSGGEDQHSRAHLDREGTLGVLFDGYRLNAGGDPSSGKRASPVIEFTLSGGERLSLAPINFWQQFPTGISANSRSIQWQFFPEHARCHELQAGESVTKSLWVELQPEEDRPLPLTWVHQPAVARPMVQALTGSQALDWFSAASTRGSQRELLDEMLSGPRNFFWKREAIDEYGWRNYGDFWADHEEAYSDDPKPVISHYNNQYDLLYGLLRQFLETGDTRWWQLAAPLAQHIVDIDIYNTDQDRSDYNHALFWHTAHYRDAGLASHRSFSRCMVGAKHAVNGGGPSNEHAYTGGLVLAYFLSGNQRYRHAVCRMAERVIAMDDGAQHWMAPLSSERSGAASSTSEPNYHGLGRGVGNSLNTLVDAWHLTHDLRYLEKCHELVHRIVHPNDAIDTLHLENIELRWSYTVALQALTRVYHCFAQVQIGSCPYIQACLLHYGRWMLAHESLALDRRDQLEFPTETWPAQDLRKGNCLLMIACFARGEEAQQMRTKGLEIFETAWDQLCRFDTRCFTRPAAIVLQQLPVFEFFSVARDEWGISPVELANRTWPARSPFIPQKERVKQQLKSPFGVIRMGQSMLRPTSWQYFFAETPFGTWSRRLRRWLS